VKRDSLDHPFQLQGDLIPAGRYHPKKSEPVTGLAC